MPRVSRFRIAAIGDLCRQLIYASPADARHRQMDAAERLINEIDPDQVYPLEFVIFRITGYRPDLGEQSASLVGEALVGDLVTLIQRLSRSLDIPAEREGRTALRLDEVARRLTVSSKTMQRYRRGGLVCHYAVFADGVKRLACFEDAIDRFRELHGARLAKAASFSRLDDAIVERIVAEAREQHRARGLTLNAAARQLAGKYRRAPETLRSILIRHDRETAEPIFDEPGPLRDRERRRIHRAVRRGIAPTVIARRYRKTLPTIHRSINRCRRELLIGLELPFVSDSLPDASDDEARLLNEPALCSGLQPLEPRIDAMALAEAVRQEPDLEIEQTLVRGYNLLKRRARHEVDVLPANPRSAQLDSIETRLRWATLIKRQLLNCALGGAFTAVRQFVGHELAREPREEILDLVRTAIEVAGETVETVPDRSQRLGALCGTATSRALTTRRKPPAGRAATRHVPGSVLLVAPFEQLTPWHPWLGLRGELQAQVARLDPVVGRLVTLRYGLGGTRPLTVAEVAEQTQQTTIRAGRLLTAAQAQLRRLRREDAALDRV